MTDQTDPSTLDQLLGAWAHDVRLPHGEVDRMRDAILSDPRAAGLHPTWWRTLAAQVAGVVVQAQRPYEPFAPAVPTPAPLP